MKNEERKYLALDEKIDVLVERIIQGGMEDFDMSIPEKELEEMLENETYCDKFYAQKLGAKGYENKSFSNLKEMEFEDIVSIHNDYYGTTISVKELDEMEVFYNLSWSATTKMIDKNGDVIVVPMWRAL